MVSIGDMKNNLRILQSEARQMKYQGDFDLEGLVKGNPKSLLPLYNYLLMDYNHEFSEEVMILLGDGLSMKSDVRFMESVYKVCRDIFHYKPPMTKEQFFTLNNYAERKVIMCYELMRLVKEHCRFKGPRNPTNPNIRVQSVVDTGRHSKRTSDCELVTSEPCADASVKSRKSSSAMMGLAEKEGWQVRLGYLRPTPGVEGGEEGRRGGLTSRESSRASREGNTDHQSKKRQAEVVDMPPGQRTLETGHLRVSDVLGRSQEHSSDWDPTEAVECILAKVRDLPTQLTNFMKAVEGRLQKIEERLDVVESAPTAPTPAAADAVNHTEGQTAVPGDWKPMLDTLQSRLLLLENRVTLCENRKISRTPSSEHPQLTEERKTELSAASPFVSLERGALAGDSFSGSLLHNFSPIHPGVRDLYDFSNNDTITSVADAEKRLSSTPNLSGTTLSLVAANGARKAPQGNINSAREAEQGTAYGTRRGREVAQGTASAAAGAEGSGDANLTAPCDNLDTSTMQQVERIKNLFKATQQLLPTGSESS